MIDFANEMQLWLVSDDGFTVQITVFVLLLLGGLGFPIPEDLPILLSGVAVSKEIVNIKTIYLICYVGVVIGDQIMYFLGRIFGHRLLNVGKRSRFLPAITEEKVARVRNGLRRRKLLFIFIARHLFPIRSATFIIAGSLRISFIEFFVADALAAFVSISIVFFLGYSLGQTFTTEAIEHIASQAHLYIGLAICFLIAVLLLRHYIVNRHKSNSPNKPEVSNQNQEAAESCSKVGENCV